MFWTIVRYISGLLAGYLGVRLFKEYRKGLRFHNTEHVVSGGRRVAEVLVNHGVDTIFCLSGGHIAPVYVEAAKAGIKVIDVRHEVNSVFAADAYARITGRVGVAAVTAGPGVTNTITAVQNAKMAQSPVVILGGATSTILRGRGSLQDIDHIGVMSTLCKWTASPSRVGDIVPAIEEALRQAASGVPGPVFVELCMDLTWPAPLVTKEAEDFIPKKTDTLMAKITKWYVTRHVNNLFEDANTALPKTPVPIAIPDVRVTEVDAAAHFLESSQRPVFVFGSQAMLQQKEVQRMQDCIIRLGVPVYLAGMARGLMGASCELQYQHERGKALKEADVVILFGAVCDFRLKYGFAINSKARLVVVNRSKKTARMNREPTLAVEGDAASFLFRLAERARKPAHGWAEWRATLDANEAAKEKSIAENAATKAERHMNPVTLCRTLDTLLDDNSIIVVDGGDFVGTAAYTLHPRQPLGWLDPGQFGTLGVGAGFAMAAKAVRPQSEVWIMYGDGALGFSIAEIDTFVRFKLGIILVIGNDACWMQMLRDQDRLLGSDTACNLNATDYHLVAEGFGAKGFLLDDEKNIVTVMNEAKRIAATGVPVLVNCLIARNDFRKGAISV